MHEVKIYDRVKLVLDGLGVNHTKSPKLSLAREPAIVIPFYPAKNKDILHWQWLATMQDLIEQLVERQWKTYHKLVIVVRPDHYRIVVAPGVLSDKEDQ